jgi:hypothetical protein
MLNRLKRIINPLLFGDVKRPVERVLEDTQKDLESKKI